MARRRRNTAGASGSYGTSQSAKRAVAQQVKSILLARQEIKQFSSGLVSAVAFSTGGLVLQLAQILQGSAVSQRSGDQIYLKEIRFQLTAFMAAAATSCTFRVIIFTDSMSNGAVPSVTDVLEFATHSSPYNDINRQRGRFKFYSDRTFTLVGATDKQECSDIVTVRPNKRVFMNDGTAGATSVGKNSPYALIIASANNGVYSREWALRYTDS